MDSPQITPEPDEAEREAILTALAAEEAERRTAFTGAETLPTARLEEDAEL